MKLNPQELNSVFVDKYNSTCPKGKEIEKGSTVMPMPIYSLDQLSLRQQGQLEKGDGRPESQICQVNSSAGLCVCYHKALEEVQRKQNPQFEVEFEWKNIPLLPLPNRPKPKPANIDARYEIDNTIYFVECKFLEPYYSHNETNREAYTDPSRYKYQKDVWVKFCTEVNEMINDGTLLNYDAAQICRHLIAIYCHYKDNPSEYEGKNIVMQSMMWDMPRSFMRNAERFGLSMNDMKSVRDRIFHDKDVFSNKVRELFSNLGWNCTFDTKTYDESLSKIQGATTYERICEQYFLK